jgi:anti-sigma regulatory factor (Ser/Thr protein kinase)
MTNAVLHGSGTAGRIRVRAELVEGTLAVSVDDDRSRLLPDGSLGALGPGLGLALIAHASDELAIAKRSAGGTALRMRFGLVSPRM